MSADGASLHDVSSARDAAPAGGSAGRGAPSRVVVMGVSSCGKSTVGELLARKLGLPFMDGDDLHPAENIAKMESGTPLDDEAGRVYDVSMTPGDITDHAAEWLRRRGEA